MSSFKYAFPLLATTLLMSSCVNPNSTLKSQSYTHTQINTNLTYEDFQKRHITFQQFFNQNNDSYIIYVYSENCSHCNELKEFILQYASKNEAFYFLPFSNDIQICSTSMTQLKGQKDLKSVFINGTPSLFHVKNKEIIEAISGKTLIKDYLYCNNTI